MNIFVTDESPVKSASVLPDKHIVKMPLETCQMLSIVASDKWGHGYGTSALRKTAHPMLRTRERSVITLVLSGQTRL